MSAEELRRAAIELFGEKGWMSRLARALGVDRSSVSRWFAGLAVPGPVAAAVRAWLELQRLTGNGPGGFVPPGDAGRERRERREDIGQQQPPDLC